MGFWVEARLPVSTHPIYKVVSFRIVGPQILVVGFDDGTTRTIDFRPVLEGEIYSPLRDQSVFAQVRIDTEAHTLVWPNGADFDPATLHDWQDQQPVLESMARTWSGGSGRDRS